nr:MAG TPA: hypothetical protein [Caudoviricetes sp.]
MSVLAVFAWLAWCIGWFVWCCLLDKASHKSLRGEGL